MMNKSPLDEFSLNELIDAVLSVHGGLENFVRSAVLRRGVTLNSVLANPFVKSELTFTHPSSLEFAITECGSVIVIDSCGNYVPL